MFKNSSFYLLDNIGAARNLFVFLVFIILNIYYSCISNHKLRKEKRICIHTTVPLEQDLKITLIQLTKIQNVIKKTYLTWENYK